jgi:hypothetical protein
VRNFIKITPFKKAVTAYTVSFIVLTLIGYYIVEAGWFGLKFSLPVVGVALMVDFILTYNKYKKWLKN